MQRLVDPAVMVVAMIVPTLHSQGLEKALHNSSPFSTCVSTLWRFDESGVTGAWIGGGGRCIPGTGGDESAARAGGLDRTASLRPPPPLQLLYPTTPTPTPHPPPTTS